MAKKKSKKKITNQVREVLAGETESSIVDELESRSHDTVIPPRNSPESRVMVLKAEYPDIYDRCRNKVGMTDVQIGCYPDAKSLLDYVNKIHPASMPFARVKEGVPPEPVKFEDNMPDSFTLESVLEAKFIKTNRDHFDRGNLQGLLRRVNRKYGQHDPVRIVTDQSFKVVKRELITKYTIYYK